MMIPLGMFQFCSHFKIDPLLATATDGGPDSDSDQTVMCVVSQQCTKATGGGAGASDNGKGMVMGSIG